MAPTLLIVKWRKGRCGTRRFRDYRQLVDGRASRPDGHPIRDAANTQIAVREIGADKESYQTGQPPGHRQDVVRRAILHRWSHPP